MKNENREPVSHHFAFDTIHSPVFDIQRNILPCTEHGYGIRPFQTKVRAEVGSGLRKIDGCPAQQQQHLTPGQRFPFRWTEPEIIQKDDLLACHTRKTESVHGGVGKASEIFFQWAQEKAFPTVAPTDKKDIEVFPSPLLHQINERPAKFSLFYPVMD